MRSSLQKGFTLIELAIVLVILGLLAGGILVGQDLIKAAEIRAVVSQKEKYDAAVNTFRGKYNALPGDISNPAAFGLSDGGLSTSTGRGDGNGLIQGSGSSSPLVYVGEPAMMWRHLSQANMIDESMTGITTYDPATVIVIGETTMPGAKSGRGSNIYLVNIQGLNNYLLAGFRGSTTAGTGEFTLAPNDTLSPTEALQIDSKTDDGLPISGTTRPVTLAASMNSAAAAGEPSPTDAGVATGSLVAGSCWDSTLNIYAANSPISRDAPGCQLRIRASF